MQEPNSLRLYYTTYHHLLLSTSLEVALLAQPPRTKDMHTEGTGGFLCGDLDITLTDHRPQFLQRRWEEIQEIAAADPDVDVYVNVYAYDTYVCRVFSYLPFNVR